MPIRIYNLHGPHGSSRPRPELTEDHPLVRVVLCSLREALPQDFGRALLAQHLIGYIPLGAPVLVRAESTMFSECLGTPSLPATILHYTLPFEGDPYLLSYLIRGFEGIPSLRVQFSNRTLRIDLVVLNRDLLNHTQEVKSLLEAELAAIVTTVEERSSIRTNPWITEYNQKVWEMYIAERDLRAQREAAIRLIHPETVPRPVPETPVLPQVHPDRYARDLDI